MLLDRYILREFLGPFLFAIVGFTVILISGLLFELTDLIFVKDVPVTVVARMLLYKVPGMMVLTLPIGVLFSTLLSLGRLNQDSELTVLRSSGVPFRRVMVPVILAGLVVSGLTYLANERIVPWSNHQFENALRQIIFEEGIPAVQENVFFRGGEDRYFYIHRVDAGTNRLQDVMVYDLSSGGFPRLITARTGAFQDNQWLLFDGIVQDMDEDGFLTHQTRFEELEIITEGRAELFFGTQKTTDEMNRQELRQHIERFQRGGLRVRSFVVDYHMKLALPMASFIFSLFGAPLSVYSRSGRSFGIAVSLVVTFIFYVATSVSRSLGVNGILPPVMAAWLTNGGFALVGGWLLLRIDGLH